MPFVMTCIVVKVPSQQVHSFKPAIPKNWRNLGTLTVIVRVEFKDIEMEEPAEGIEDIHIEYCTNITYENMKIVPRTECY